jgi:hypothetical protein
LRRARAEKFKRLARAIFERENESEPSRFLRAQGEKFRERARRKERAPRGLVRQAKDSDDRRAGSSTWRILRAPGEKFRELPRSSDEWRVASSTLRDGIDVS